MILARLAHLVHQVLPVYSERLTVEHLANQDLLGCQEKMDTRFVCQKDGLCAFPSHQIF